MLFLHKARWSNHRRMTGRRVQWQSVCIKLTFGSAVFWLIKGYQMKKIEVILPKLAATVGFVGWPYEELEHFQEEDDIIFPVLCTKDVDQMPELDDIKWFSQHTNRLFALWDQLTLEEGVLYRRYVPVDGRTNSHLQLVVPKSLRKEILKELHEGAMGAHLGEEKLLNQVKQRFYWPGHFNDVKNWCRTCPTCAVSKTPPKKPRAALHSIQSGYPLQIVATDILGPLPESSAGNSYLLVVGDYFSRFMEAYPIHNMEAPTVARVLLDKFFCHFGIPEQLVEDHYREPSVRVGGSCLKGMHGIQHLSTIYHRFFTILPHVWEGS